MPLVTIYSQAWPVAKVNTGAFKTNDDYNRTGPPVFGPHPVDPDYPEISRTEDVKVTASAGPSGENALDIDGNFSDAGARMWGLGTEEGKPSAPTSGTGGFWNADAGRARVSYKFNAAAWGSGDAFYYPLIILSSGSSFSLAVYADFETTSGNPRPYFMLNVEWADWTTSGDVWVQPDGSAGPRTTARQFARAAFVDQWYELILEHQCGTIIGDWDDLDANGSIRLSFRNIATNVTEEIFTLSAIQLYSSDYYEVLHHQLRAVDLGFYGMFGQNTNLVIESGIDDGPPIEPEEPEAVFDPNEAPIGLTWIEFTDHDGHRHVWSSIALPDPVSYFGGFKEHRVIEFGVIRRGLSNIDGQYEGIVWGWTLSG